jgi:hypothetical protein
MKAKRFLQQDNIETAGNTQIECLYNQVPDENDILYMQDQEKKKVAV